MAATWQQFARNMKPDGPEIFDRAWNRKDQLRKEAVLARFWEKKEVRMKYVLDYVPWSWRDIVCICDPSDIGYKSERKHKCGKYARWVFFRSCFDCGNPYVVDHNHPKKNGRTCYDCLVKKYGPMGSENFFVGMPRELGSLDDEGVFDIPDMPVFNF